MTPNHEHFMRMAIEEARVGERDGNQPVGSVIVRDGRVIARGHNLALSTLDVTAHAETVALRNAGPVTGGLEFPGATLYTTFQPCPMCLGAILVARVATLVMGGRPTPGQSAWGQYTVEAMLGWLGLRDRLAVVPGILQRECEEMSDQWRRQHQAS